MADGLLSRLRRWIVSLFGRESTEGDQPAASEPAPPEQAYKCDICGTPVASPDDPCPLCHSDAIVPMSSDADADERAPSSDAESGPRPVERRVADDESGDPAASLAELRGSGNDPLTQYADQWEDRGSEGSRRYRVSLPEGGERFVGSREEVRALLFREYGTNEADGSSDGTDSTSEN